MPRPVADRRPASGPTASVRRLGRRRFLQAGAAAAAALAAPRIVRAQEELNILVWCDNIDPKLLGPFEEAAGVRINAKDYQETGAALAILEQSQPGDWDVFVVDSADVRRVAQRGLLAELKDSDIPWDDIFPELRAPDFHYVDGKLYAAPEKFGYNAIAFNNEKVDAADVQTAAIMWNTKYSDRIAIYDYYIPTMEMVGLAMGTRPNELDEEKLGPIRDKLLEMKQLASVIGDVPTVQNAMVTGSADIIVAGGEFAVAGLASESPWLDWTIPREGGIRWMQAIALFADSKKHDLGLRFLQYVLSPQGQAALATAECYWAMPANSKTELGEAERKRLRWDEQDGFIKNSYPYFIPDEALDKKMLEVWTEFLQA
ncbi:MAG: extracellular solute-binding protein [Rhodospirillaceae bacterium]|nr:extracellular solute-binding protein [Rhodospirillaceae bacterium]